MIEERKKDHVKLCVEENVFYDTTTGFERYSFNHNALNEVNFSEISTKASLLGHSFDFPLMVSSMTGGYRDGGEVNKQLAAFCLSHNLPMGIGSQRVMLENPTLIDSFKCVRDVGGENLFVAANIGGVQLKDVLEKDWLELLIHSIKANALIIHLNPLQELMQVEGDRDFTGILSRIQTIVELVNIPVIVKETGAGISRNVAKQLLNAGVQALDVSGSGGTSWAKVENKRFATNESWKEAFNNWGIPTVDCIKSISPLKNDYNFELIASGGLYSAFDLAKALCLGSDFGAIATPIIRALKKGGKDELNLYYQSMVQQFKVIMALLGITNISLFNENHLICSK